jgi:GT2 family glycosyltransferase
MYAEDLDLGWRLREAGWATRCEPRAVVDHESAAATTQLFGPDVAPHWQRATYGCIARRRGAERAWATALVQIAGAGGRWAWHAALATAAPERHARPRDNWRRWVGVHRVALRSRARLDELR